VTADSTTTSSSTTGTPPTAPEFLDEDDDEGDGDANEDWAGEGGWEWRAPAEGEEEGQYVWQPGTEGGYHWRGPGPRGDEPTEASSTAPAPLLPDWQTLQDLLAPLAEAAHETPENLPQYTDAAFAALGSMEDPTNPTQPAVQAVAGEGGNETEPAEPPQPGAVAGHWEPRPDGWSAFVDSRGKVAFAFRLDPWGQLETFIPEDYRPPKPLPAPPRPDAAVIKPHYYDNPYEQGVAELMEEAQRRRVTLDRPEPGARRVGRDLQEAADIRYSNKPITVRSNGQSPGPPPRWRPPPPRWIPPRR